MLGGLAAPEGSSHPVESIFPPRHTGTVGTSNYGGGLMLMLILLQANMIDTCGTHPKSIIIVVITNLIKLFLLFPTISMMDPCSFGVVADFGVQIVLFYLAQ